jgi:hypothetical protein
MKRCAWCYQADVPNNVHDDNEVGAIDTEGDWICDDCKNDAIEEGKHT